jgi:hypothetical protein
MNSRQPVQMRVVAGVVGLQGKQLQQLRGVAVNLAIHQEQVQCPKQQQKQKRRHRTTQSLNRKQWLMAVAGATPIAEQGGEGKGMNE